MSSLICMCCFDTKENERTKYTKETLEGLLKTVDFNKHKLHITDNASCNETKVLLRKFSKTFATMFPAKHLKIVTLKNNLGTAIGVSLGFRWMDKNTTACIKLDNDITHQYSGWIEEMEAVIERQPKIGVVTLKRKDFGESPFNENPQWRTKLLMLPHERGQSWICVEQTNSAMSNCQMYSRALIEKIGEQFQDGVYGWDDLDYCTRAELGGFAIVFLLRPEINHLDDGANPYTQEKGKIAGQSGKTMQEIQMAYRNGTRSIFYKHDLSKIK